MQVSQKGCKRITTITHTLPLEVLTFGLLPLKAAMEHLLQLLCAWFIFSVNIAILDATPKVLHFKAHLEHIGLPACKLPAYVPFLRMTLRSYITWQSLICFNISIQKPCWFSKAMTQVALLAVSISKKPPGFGRVWI